MVDKNVDYIHPLYSTRPPFYISPKMAFWWKKLNTPPTEAGNNVSSPIN
jgi:hypothetical protein